MARAQRCRMTSFRRVPMTQFWALPLDYVQTASDAVVAYSPCKARVARLSRVEMAVLNACRTPAVFEIQVSRALAVSSQCTPVPSRAAVEASVMDLHARGLLVTLESLLECAPRTGPRRWSDECVYGVVTKDRAALLGRCVSGFARNARAHGRSATFLVADSSRNPAAAREVLRGVRRGGLGDVSHLERGPISAMCDRLTRTSGAPQSVVAFALAPGGAIYPDIGANRNVLLLLATGGGVVCIDDDVVCALREWPDGQPGWRIADSHEPAPVRWASSFDDCRRLTVEASTDHLEWHERFLGRSVAELLHEAHAGEPGVSVDALSARSTAAILDGSAKVTATFAGIVGDSGLDSPSSLLFAAGERRALLIEEEARYAQLRQSRLGVRLVRQPTLTCPARGITACLGLDARGLLPPFLPVGRNEDGLFFTMCGLVQSGSFGVYLPVAVEHSPNPARECAEDAISSRIVRLAPGDVIAELFADIRFSPVCDPASRLRRLGEHLIGCATLPLAAFVELLTAMVRRRWMRVLQAYTALLTRHAEAPRWWAGDVTAAVEGLSIALEDGQIASRLECSESFLDANAAVASLQHITHRFGEMLLWWPAIWDAGMVHRDELRALGRMK